MNEDDLVFRVLGSFQIYGQKGLIDEYEAQDLITFCNSKTCGILCKVLNKIARLEVEGSAEGDESHRAVGIGKAEAMFQLVDHLNAVRKVLEVEKPTFDPTSL